MKELVKRPAAKVERRAVEAALLRLLRYPGTFSVGAMMRMVDEYAASLHTSRVYQHAEKIVGEALVDAHGAVELGKNIFVCVVLNEGSGVEAVEKFFHDEGKIFIGKNFFYHALQSALPVKIMVADPGGTNPTCPISPISPVCPISPECREGDECPGCPICPNTPVRDTSGRTTSVTDTRDTDTAVTDKGGLATSAGDSSDPIVRVLTDDAQPTHVPTDDTSTVHGSADTCRTPAPVPSSEGGESTPLPVPGTPNVDTGGCESGKNCTRCGRSLPLAAYSRNRARADGHASACRECESARKRGVAVPQSAAMGPQNGA